MPRGDSSKRQALDDTDHAIVTALVAGVGLTTAEIALRIGRTAAGHAVESADMTRDAAESVLTVFIDSIMRQIVNAGFVLQVDDAILPMMYSWRFRHRPFTEYLAWAELRIEALNRALEGIPEDRVRYHICFGSHNMPHTSDPSLRDLIALVLRVRAQGYSLEASNPRHEHEWQLWKDMKLPPGKILLPGVVGHATNIVEHPELIALRIANFANLVGRENVIASSDCGFSQAWNSPRVHAQVQWAKLESLVEGARTASRQLWGRGRS